MSQSDVAREYYEQHYRSSQRSGLQGWGNSLIDVQIERFAARKPDARVLEVGASSGEHFAFVPKEPRIDRYVALDVFPGVTNPKLAKQLGDAGLVEFVKADASAIPFDDDSFDLVYCTCLLAHVAQPEKVLEEMRRVTKPGGRVVIGMPCDPGMVNRLIKVLVTYRAMRRAGVGDPRLSYAREHINPVGNLIALAKYVFRDDRLRFNYFPLRLPSWNVNLAITVISIKSERTAK